MAGQHAIERDVQDEASRAAAEPAALKLEQFLPYRLNVVANLVSQALSRAFTPGVTGSECRNGGSW